MTSSPPSTGHLDGHVAIVTGAAQDGDAVTTPTRTQLPR